MLLLFLQQTEGFVAMFNAFATLTTLLHFYSNNSQHWFKLFQYCFMALQQCPVIVQHCQSFCAQLIKKTAHKVGRLLQNGVYDVRALLSNTTTSRYVELDKIKPLTPGCSMNKDHISVFVKYQYSLFPVCSRFIKVKLFCPLLCNLM